MRPVKRSRQFHHKGRIMNSAKIDKSKQINDIVSTVKLASRLFKRKKLFK